jgi:hydroxyacylglutathione hydrolase
MNKASNLPESLASSQAKGFSNGEPIAQFEIGSQQNFIYLVLDFATKQAAIVDPQKDLTAPMKALSENGFTLTTLILTHTHFDHTAGVVPLLSQMPNLEIRAGELDLHRLPKSVLKAPGFKVLQDGEKFRVGSIEIEALHTPGHSAGAFSYFMKTQGGLRVPYLLTGDTIFIRDCGRTDLDTGSTREMFDSIQRVKKLPPETVLLVGHHYARECATTLKTELQESPPFRCKSVEELEALP